MGLSNVTIELDNGALGRSASTDDGVAGFILTGAPEGSAELNKVLEFSSVRDLKKYGITAEGNPLLYKDINSFFSQAGDGAELYVIIVSESMTLRMMCSAEDGSPLRKLVDYAKGRIRLVGVNRLMPAEYVPNTETHGIDEDVVLAAQAAQQTAADYARKISPFRLFLPVLGWTGTTENLFKPREGSCNRVMFVMASDEIIREKASPAIGQVMGRAASVPVHYSIARVKSGAIAAKGYTPDGKAPEASAGLHDALNDAGYVFYRTFIRKNGYYLNDDHMGAPLSDDYSNLNLGRVIDKAIIIAYVAFIEEIQDSIEVDASTGKLAPYMCTYFEGNINNAVSTGMRDEVSDFSAYIDPAQNILSTSRMDVSCKIVPKGILREINVKLGFENPALKQ